MDNASYRIPQPAENVKQIVRCHEDLDRLYTLAVADLEAVTERFEKLVETVVVA